MAHPIQIILTRQLAGYLSVPTFLVDPGPVILMIENYRTGLLWDIMRRCQPIVNGLRKAGFAGGWLN